MDADDCCFGCCAPLISKSYRQEYPLRGTRSAVRAPNASYFHRLGSRCHSIMLSLNFHSTEVRRILHRKAWHGHTAASLSCDIACMCKVSNTADSSSTVGTLDTSVADRRSLAGHTYLASHWPISTSRSTCLRQCEQGQSERL